nr:hypothetical protein [Tanacetum cinerariifolium]
MASFDYRLNPLYPIKECSSCGALHTTNYCCSDGSLRDKIICDLNKTLDLFQEPPQNCPKCGNPVDEPIVVNQDPGKDSSQSPPRINHNCYYGCGDSLEDIFCHQCTYELCGKGAHYGYNCPPKVLIIPNLEPCINQTIDELPQTLPSFDPTCYSRDGNSFTYDFKYNILDDSLNIFNSPPQPSTYSYEFCRNDVYYGHDCPLQVSFAYDPEPLTLGRFKKLLMKEYCLDDDIQKVELEFWNHKMVGSDIDGYTARFHELARLVPHMVTLESQRVNCYIRGLALKIKPRVTSSEPATI